MGFFFGHLKLFFQSISFFIIFLSCFSCQNLDHNKSSFSIKKSNIYKKNIDFQKKHLKSDLLDQKNSTTPIIDQNYFEIYADKAYLKGEEAFFEDNNTEALRYFKKALLFAPNSSHLQKRVAKIYEQEGLFAEAFNRYKNLSEKTKKNKEFHQKLTEIYKLKGLNKRALENHQYLLKQEPDNISLWFEQVFLLISQADWTEALKILNKVEAKALNSEQKVQIILSQSYIFASLKDFSKSLKTMDKLANIPIREVDLILKVAAFYKSLGQNLMAVSYLENFQKTQGVTQLVSKILLEHYISDENWEKALQKMRQIQALGQFENHHYFYMAMLLLEKQNYDKALVFLKDLVAKAPKQGQYLYLLAFVYEQKKEWFSALNTYNKVQTSSPHFLAAKLQAAQVLKQIGQEKKSFSLLKKLSFSSDGGINPQPLLLYAESLWNSGYKKKTLYILTKGLDDKPFHTDILFLRGFYLKQSGQSDLALKDMNQILKNKENHEEALNFIASFYSEKETNLNTAEEMARKALSLQPNSSPFLNTLGWILFQKGDWKSALHYLNKAFSTNNKDTHVAKRLGKVHLQLKNFKKSEYFFKEASRLEKDDEKNRQTKKNLIPKQALIQ